MPTQLAMIHQAFTVLLQHKDLHRLPIKPYQLGPTTMVGPIAFIYVGIK